MAKEKDHQKPKIIIASSEVGLRPFRVVEVATTAYDGYGAHLRIDRIPSRDRQNDYTHGEGPGGISQRDVITEIDSDTLFDMYIAQVVVERLEKKFSQIAGHLGLRQGLALFTEPLTSTKRYEITHDLVGAYPRDNIYFVSTEGIRQKNLGKIQQQILFEFTSLPYGWEIAQSNNPYQSGSSFNSLVNLKLRPNVK